MSDVNNQNGNGQCSRYAYGVESLNGKEVVRAFSSRNERDAWVKEDEEHREGPDSAKLDATKAKAARKVVERLQEAQKPHIQRAHEIERGWDFGAEFKDSYRELTAEDRARKMENLKQKVAQLGLTQEELMACDSLLRQLKEEIEESDDSVQGFNIGMNAGAVAGQTIFHCHIHLIPRREGDVENPRGGVRHLIPGKGNY